jgi:hypothetical protein
MAVKKVKPKICRAPGCEVQFTPTHSTTQKVCSPLCAIELDKHKKKTKREKETRALKKEMNEKDRNWQLKQTQIVFNKFIRLRDHDQPCISCERLTGAKMNAGHYRSVGAASQLRFNEDNVHRQCEHCNCHKSGNQIEYRIHLVAKIGCERVEALESDNVPHKWEIDELVALRAHYKQKIKEFKASQE